MGKSNSLRATDCFRIDTGGAKHYVGASIGSYPTT